MTVRDFIKKLECFNQDDEIVFYNQMYDDYNEIINMEVRCDDVTWNEPTLEVTFF